jgi:hypothetical protein
MMVSRRWLPDEAPALGRKAHRISYARLCDAAATRQLLSWLPSDWRPDPIGAHRGCGVVRSDGNISRSAGDPGRVQSNRRRLIMIQAWIG